ncbi:heme oxygenase-like protein [Backusella circina FSU 941]|nr:heme oxygenase-like protein [Backusella circina FSU 941]
MKLTEHLLSLDTDNFKKATQHEFLKQVGQFDIKPEHLKAWIIQDRFYTGGYVSMMGTMVSRLALFEDQRELGDNDPSFSVTRSQGILKTLSFALSNVYREANFFTEILNKPCYSMDQSVTQKETTLRYIEFEKKVARESGYDLGEALIVLWAMEKVFYTAWSYAKSISSSEQQQQKTDDLHLQSCRELMENWTLPEFNTFVEECAFHVDQLSTKDPRRLQSFEKTYRDCLALEVIFWESAFD